MLAFKVGILAFDATRLCAADVDFPMDVLLYTRGSFEIVEKRYERDDLRAISDWWQERMRHLPRQRHCEDGVFDFHAGGIRGKPIRPARARAQPPPRPPSWPQSTTGSQPLIVKYLQEVFALRLPEHPHVKLKRLRIPKFDLGEVSMSRVQQQIPFPADRRRWNQQSGARSIPNPLVPESM
jgi:hypothetical protein